MPAGNCEDSWYDMRMRYAYQQLTERERTMFHAAYQAAMEYRSITFIIRTEPLNENETARVFRALCQDCPELFQFYTYSMMYTINGDEITYTVSSKDPYCTKTEYEQRSERIRQAIEEINQSISAGADDYEVELACYRYLIEHCAYLQDEPYTISAYSSIVYGHAQCAGYAKGLALLLRCAGIPSLVVSSDDHDWNIVRINGIWYQCDATWDDPLGNTFEFLAGQDPYLPHFNIPDRLMLRLESHTYSPSPFIVPVCTDIRDSYTARSGIYIPAGTAEAGEKLKAAIRNAYAAGKRKLLIRVDGALEYSVLEDCARNIYSIVPELAGTSLRCYTTKKPELFCVYIEFK